MNLNIIYSQAGTFFILYTILYSEKNILMCATFRNNTIFIFYIYFTWVALQSWNWSLQVSWRVKNNILDRRSPLDLYFHRDSLKLLMIFFLWSIKLKWRLGHRNLCIQCFSRKPRANESYIRYFIDYVLVCNLSLIVLHIYDLQLVLVNMWMHWRI